MRLGKIYSFNLEPCPFCPEAPAPKVVDDRRGFYIQCQECKTTMMGELVPEDEVADKDEYFWMDLKQTIVDKWNSRIPSEDLLEGVRSRLGRYESHLAVWPKQPLQSVFQCACLGPRPGKAECPCRLESKAVKEFMGPEFWRGVEMLKEDVREHDE